MIFSFKPPHLRKFIYTRSDFARVALKKTVNLTLTFVRFTVCSMLTGLAALRVIYVP